MMRKGSKHSAETLAKMSLIKIGKRCSNETKRKKSEIMKAKYVSGEMIGNRWTERSRMKMSLSMLGKKHSDDWRHNISENMKKQWMSGKRNRYLNEETKRKLSLANFGKKLSKEHKMKISLGMMGRKNTLGKKRFGYGGMYGKRHSDETKKKMSLTHKKNMTDEIREKMSGRIPWNKGLTKEDDERLRKLSEDRIGIKLSDEHRMHISESHKGCVILERARKLISEAQKKRFALGIHEFNNRGNVLRGVEAAKLTHGREDVRRKMSLAHIGKKPTKEQNKKNSLTHAGLLKTHKGKFGPYKDIMFRSKEEIMVAKNLDAVGIIWEYEPKYFILKNGWTYTPDFKVDFGWLEVKGFCSLRAIKKINMFVGMGNNLFLIDGRNINNPGLYDAIPWEGEF